MPDVPNPADAPRAAAKAGGKGLKAITNQKPVVYAGVAVAILIMAYIIRKRQQDASPLVTGPDSAPAVGSDDLAYGATDTTAYPNATQGAYYGYSAPVQQDYSDPQANPWAQVSEFMFDLLSSGVVTGGGPPGVPPDSHGVGEIPVPGPGPNAPVPPPPPPVVIGSTPQPTTKACPPDYPHRGPNGKSCYRHHKVTKTINGKKVCQVGWLFQGGTFQVNETRKGAC